MARYLIIAEVVSWVMCALFVHIVLGQYGIGPTSAAHCFGQVVAALEHAQ